MARKRSWTDEQLRAAVESATSLKATMARLGLRPSGVGYYDVRARIRTLELDTSHFIKRRSPSYPWTEAQLREAAASSTSRLGILAAMKFEPAGRHLVALQRHMHELGLATPRDRRRRWSDDDLRIAVVNARGVASTIRGLRLVPAGGNYDQVQRRIVELGLDTSHFRGTGWSKGLKLGYRPRVPLSDVLVENRWTTSHKLKNRLFRAGLKQPCCEMCGWAEWSADGRLPLELDHINGVNTDNRLQNLRVLCPNCHSLQPTHRGSNKRHRRKKAGPS